MEEVRRRDRFQQLRRPLPRTWDPFVVALWTFVILFCGIWLVDLTVNLIQIEVKPDRVCPRCIQIAENGSILLTWCGLRTIPTNRYCPACKQDWTANRFEIVEIVTDAVRECLP